VENHPSHAQSGRLASGFFTVVVAVVRGAPPFSGWLADPKYIVVCGIAAPNDLGTRIHLHLNTTTRYPLAYQCQLFILVSSRVEIVPVVSLP
jgi:hypothetical protein